jgi:hypothetical protein
MKTKKIEKVQICQNAPTPLSWKWSSNEKWFLVFSQIVSYVKKLKI